jgi:hypothetical protein
MPSHGKNLSIMNVKKKVIIVKHIRKNHARLGDTYKAGFSFMAPNYSDRTMNQTIFL